MSDTEDDDQFAVAHAAWRQFHGLRLDLPAPTQPEIDARLLRYRRGHETGAMRNLAAGTLMLAGIGKALADMTAAFARSVTVPEVLIFALTCVLLIAVGARSLAHLRKAVEHHALAQRIGAESVDWSRVDSMFADTREADVRAYLHSVRAGGRSLRRAEAAVALDRGRGAQATADAGAAAFRVYLRDGRDGPTRKDLATAAACLIAAAATHAPGFDPATMPPALLLLGAWTAADLTGPLIQLTLDPWALRGGGPHCQQARYGLLAELVPLAAVLMAVIATTVGIAGL